MFLFVLDGFLFFLERGLGLLHVGVQRFGLRHELQRTILGFPNFLLNEFDFVLESLILLVGLSACHLLAKLGNLLVVHLNVAVQFLAVALVGGERGPVGFQAANVRVQHLHDGNT